MARTPENLAFANRLKQALTRSKQKVDGPTQLANAFNLQYSGNPITTQAAQKWLAGDNKPSVEKIELLASLLNVSALWLRLGIAEARVPQVAASSLTGSYGSEVPTADELRHLANFRLLSAHQRLLVEAVTEQFALEQAMWIPLGSRAD